MQQAEDFRAEAEALGRILADLPDNAFDTRTQFKGWSINDVIGHLHLFDMAALHSLRGAEDFAVFVGPLLSAMKDGKTILELQFPWLNGLSGRALFDAWMRGAHSLADAFAVADPKARLKWLGPDMSALSSVTARQMETWAHGQEIFDVLGLERAEKDRIRNIVYLGVNTYGWTFKVRGLQAPDPAPFVELAGPSGAVWTWNEPQEGNSIRGSAVDFARVVTQVRNIADTGLRLKGETAQFWMENAQCFAGPPETPPAPGQRQKAEI